MRVHKGTALVAGVAALALGLTACGSSSKNPSASGSTGSKPTGTIIYGESTDFPENLMPLISSGNSTAVANIEVRLLPGPFRTTPQIAYEPDPDQVVGTPTSTTNSAGQQVVTYNLNPKAKWDDGQPITAKDYEFTWSINKGGCAALLGTTGYDQIESVTGSNNDETVTVTFAKGKSYADWKALFTLFSQHAMDKGSTKANCDYITTGWPIADGIPAGMTGGPWLLQKANINVANKTLSLVPNPNYGGAQPKLARLIYNNIGSDSNTNVTSLQNQEVNMIYPQPQLDLVANLKKLTNVTTEINFGTAFEHLDFNTRDPLLSMLPVRQAIAYGIDRKDLVSATVAQFDSRASVLGNRLLVTNQTGYQDNGTDYDAPNTAKAISLLEGAGATKGSDGYYSIGGKELSFQIITTQSNPLRDTTIARIGTQLKAIGIKISEYADPDIFNDATHPRSLEAGGFQIALFAWVGGPNITANDSIYESIPYQTQQAGSAAQGQNYSHGGTTEIDNALIAMSTATDTTTEIADANKADQLLWAQMYTLPLYQKPTLLAFDSNYQGIGDNATNAGPLWNSDTWSVG